MSLCKDCGKECRTQPPGAPEPGRIIEGASRCERCGRRRAELMGAAREDTGDQTVDLVLNAVSQGVVTRGKIAAYVRKDPACVTKALARMRQQGLVEISGVSNRVKTWALTENGMAVLPTRSVG